MWSQTVGLVNGKHRYLTAETFGFKINSNGQMLKKRQQWTIEPFPENLGPDGSISSAASVSSQQAAAPTYTSSPSNLDSGDPCILTLNSVNVNSSLTSVKSSSNGSSTSDQEICGEEHENVALKSHLNKYLAVDSFGNVTCDSDEKSENARFTITICSMSQSRSKEEHIFWAFKNVERGYYLGTTEDGMICCNAKMPKSRAELWHLHLLPARGASLFSLKSLARERCARVVGDDAQSKQVQVDAAISWGSETLFHFKYHEGGKYSILTSDCLYLTNEGKCIPWKQEDESNLAPTECLFTLEYHGGYLAFRDSFSQYLAAAGRPLILRSRSAGVSRDELFSFERAPLQVSFKATFNNRWVSIKQGIDLSANQSESNSDHETFQLIFHKQTQLWSIMTHALNFWTVMPNTTTISLCGPAYYKESMDRGRYKIIWSDNDATCSMKHVDLEGNEKWISARKSGQLYLSNGAQPPVRFIVRIQNRRLINLRPVDGSGFVGLKGGNSRQLETNKTSPDSLLIEYIELSDSTSNLTDRLKVEESKQSPSPDEPRVKMFNVKLNSTRQGSSILDRSQDLDSFKQETVEMERQQEIKSKEIDDGMIDDNNNTSTDDDLETTLPESNGSVEFKSTPSVASIINSFSNVEVGSSNEQSNFSNRTQPLSATERANLSVFKLASSFETSQLSPSNPSTETNTTTSCISNRDSCDQTNPQQMSGNKSMADHLAQSECCYLKFMANDKYLVVNTGDSSIICDTTNKACAQSWILELRTNNSIAIRASDTHAYMQKGTNGTILLSRCEPKDATLWEF